MNAAARCPEPNEAEAPFESSAHDVATVPGVGRVRVTPVQRSPFSLRLKLKMRLWSAVQATLFRWSPTPLRAFRRGLLSLFGARIANTASVHNTARIDCPWNLEMAPRASVGEHAWIYALDRIVIGEEACVGQRVVLLTGSHDYANPCFPLVTRPITVGYGCWIAVGAMVLPGVTVGALAVVGAGSVVTRDVPEQMVCGGNPCRVLKRREFHAEERRASPGPSA